MLTITLSTLALLIVVGLSAAHSAGTTHIYLPALPCATCTGPTLQPPSPTPDTSTYDDRMIELVNQARADAGCPAATPHATLMQATSDWSATMAQTGNYTHSGGGYYASYGYPNGPLENIGTGETPEYAFEGWMESPTHRRNIEFCYLPSDPSYNPAMMYDIGVGYMNGYWTLAISNHTP